MSAALVDEFSFDGYTSVVRTQRGARPIASTSRPSVGGRQAPCEHGVPVVPSAGPSWRLTERGIAVVLALFFTLFVAGVTALVGAFFSVSDAPLHAAPAVVSGVVSVIGG